MLSNAHSMLMNRVESLSERLALIHDNILQRVSLVDRVSCAIYDPATDLLKTFINSTRNGNALNRYQYPLEASVSLSRLAASGECRVIDSIPGSVSPDNPHSVWLLEQGYQSSFTVPLFSGDHLVGFVFFDSLIEAAFTDIVQRDLVLFCNLILMAIVSELTAVSCLMTTAQVAREFVTLRDFETGSHLTRMALFARLIARDMAQEYNLDDEFVEHLYLFAPLHDIGKIGVPDQILLKPGKLNDTEWAVMKSHVVKGVDIIRRVLKDYQLSHMVDSRLMINIVAGHHERLDGSGYPKGLVGDEIPLEARIVAVADMLDALTSKRPYKEAWPLADAFDELRHLAAIGQIDSRCVQALLDNHEVVADIISHYRDPEEQPRLQK